MNTVTPTTTPTEKDTQAHDDTARAVYNAMRALTGPHGVWPAGVFPVGATLMPFAWCDWEDLGLCGNDHIRRTALCYGLAAAAEGAMLDRLSAALDRQAARAVDAPGRRDTYGRLIDALVEIARAMGVERVGGVRVAEHDADDDASGEDGTWERDV